MNSITRRRWIASLAGLVPMMAGGHGTWSWKENGEVHPLSPHKTFASFMVGVHNEEAVAACLSVVGGAGPVPSMVYLWGPPGAGKTHLLQATARAVGEARGGGAAWYGTAPEFSAQLIRAVQDGQSARFRGCFRPLSVLLLDDVQLLRDFERTTEELVELVGWIADAGGSVVISGSMPPGKVTRSGRLAERVHRGLVKLVGPMQTRSWQGGAENGTS